MFSRASVCQSKEYKLVDFFSCIISQAYARYGLDEKYQLSVAYTIIPSQVLSSYEHRRRKGGWRLHTN